MCCCFFVFVLFLLLLVGVIVQVQLQVMLVVMLFVVCISVSVVLIVVLVDWCVLDGQCVCIVVLFILVGSDGLEYFGQFMVVFDGCFWQLIEVVVLGIVGYEQVMVDNQCCCLVLEDGSDVCDLVSVVYLLGSLVLCIGMQLCDVQGIVCVDVQGYLCLQVEGVLKLLEFKCLVVLMVLGSLYVVVFNLENFFNGDGQGGGFLILCGVCMLDEYKVQVVKLVIMVNVLGVDVVVLMELENDGYGLKLVIVELVDVFNCDRGVQGDWCFVDVGNGFGDNLIWVGIIYCSLCLQLVGMLVMLIGGLFVEYSCVLLVQVFQGRQGVLFVVVVNYFKLKGCCDVSGVDVDCNDNQGCWNVICVILVQ